MVTAPSRRKEAKSRWTFDVRATWGRMQSQFQGLDPKEPGQWPVLPKLAAWTAAVGATVVVGWFVMLSEVASDIQAKREREPALKSEFRTKLSQAINLDELRKQKLQVQEYVNQLERQLPSQAEMDALLSEVNQAGLGRGLMFESFRPGQAVVRDYYAELPIAIRITGRFHDIGGFAGDVAALSRIVTLDGMSLQWTSPEAASAGGATPRRVGDLKLTLDATARTYRYLDPAEAEARQKARNNAKAGKK